VWKYGRVPSFRSASHSKSEIKAHLVWIPKYRKAVLVGPVALRVRDLLREMAKERKLTIVSGKVARDPVHLLIARRPHQSISQIVQWLKGISFRMLLEEFPHLRKQFWGRHLLIAGSWQKTEGGW
jgi:putative transposase